MTLTMRHILARQPFERKLEQVAQLIAMAKAIKAARSTPGEDCVKERDALFAGETVESLFEQAAAFQTK